MRILLLTIYSVTLLSLSTVTTLANADTPETCALIESPAKRLSCYDSLFRQPSVKLSDKENVMATDKATNASAINNDSRLITRQEAAAKSLVDASERRATDAEARMVGLKADNSSKASLVSDLTRPPEINKPALPNPALPNNTILEETEDLFGAERIQKDDISIPDDVSFTVSTITENQRKVRTFTFSNNQVWREISKNRLKVREGDTVTISKGTFTSYYLSKEGINRKTQVKRIR